MLIGGAMRGEGVEPKGAMEVRSKGRATPRQSAKLSACMDAKIERFRTRICLLRSISQPPIRQMRERSWR
jgi:hypothetical protein